MTANAKRVPHELKKNTNSEKGLPNRNREGARGCAPMFPGHARTAAAFQERREIRATSFTSAARRLSARFFGGGRRSPRRGRLSIPGIALLREISLCR